MAQPPKGPKTIAPINIGTVAWPVTISEAPTTAPIVAMAPVTAPRWPYTMEPPV